MDMMQGINLKGMPTGCLRKNCARTTVPSLEVNKKKQTNEKTIATYNLHYLRK